MSSRRSGKPAPEEEDERPRGAPRPGGPRGQQQQQAQERLPPTAADHLRVALRATHETEEMGAETLGELERQGEQLNRIQRKLDATEAHADRSNWLLRGMKSIFSFRGKEPPKPKDVVAKRQAARGGGKGKAAAGDDDGDDDDEEGDEGGGGGGGTPPGRQGSQQQQQHQKRAPRPAPRSAAEAARAQEDAMLDALSASVSRIKVTAVGIGDELDRQDTKVDDITTSVERVEGKVKKATRTARDLAR